YVRSLDADGAAPRGVLRAIGVHRPGREDVGKSDLHSRCGIVGAAPGGVRRMIEIPGDRGELIRYFRDECDELVAQIDADLLQLETLASAGRSDPERINSLFRALHTIKGSSGMLGMNDVAALAHKLESACDLLRTGRGALSKPLIDVLFDGRDLLTALIRCGIEGTAPPPAGVAEELLA